MNPLKGHPLQKFIARWDETTDCRYFSIPIKGIRKSPSYFNSGPQSFMTFWRCFPKTGFDCLSPKPFHIELGYLVYKLLPIKAIIATNCVIQSIGQEPNLILSYLFIVRLFWISNLESSQIYFTLKKDSWKICLINSSRVKFTRKKLHYYYNKALK